jgi:PAS domain S-box-containing protein
MIWAVMALALLNILAIAAVWRMRRRRRAASHAASASIAHRDAAPAGAGPPSLPQQSSAHDQLRRLAERNQAILQSAMDGFFVVGQDYRFVEVNESFCRMTGYTADELQTLRITDLEVEQPPSDASAATHARTGLHHFPTAHRHKSGHIIYLEISVIVLKDDGRKILVGFARDVTERIRTEQEIERLARHNKLILDSAGEGICGVDLSATLTFMNPAGARMLGYEPHEPIGRPFDTVVRPLPSDLRDAEHESSLAAVLRDGVARSILDATFQRKDGQRVPVEYTCTPIRERGRVAGAVIVFADIAERKRQEQERRRLEREVQQAQKLESLGVLAGGIAHDFNNLLVGMLGNAFLALEHLTSDSQAREHVQKIINASQRASQITHQMLAYSGRAGHEILPLNVNELVGEMADFMRAAVPRSVALTMTLGQGLPLIEADAGQIQQVFMNLLVNAVEAIGDQTGSVTIATDAVELSSDDAARDFTGTRLDPGRYLRLSVSDSGCGIPADVLPRIFEPFFSRKAAGRGLGLAALLGIVRAHRGGIFVDSRTGRGTTFILLFPASRRTAAVHTPPDAATVPRGATVLVIDDEEDIRDVVESILTRRGFRVLSAADGREGLATFRANRNQVDLVLLDLTMPGLSGGAVFAEIVALKPDARVVISSGYSERETLARFGARQPAGFVHKPYTADALVTKLTSVLAATRPTAAAAP